MKRISLPVLILLTFIFTQCSTTKDSTAQFIKAKEVKNIILMIGDGMGVTQVYAGITANKGLNLEKSKYVGLSKTYSANNYITDSAAGGTAISTGKKTNNGAIGVDKEGNEIKTILEYAAENGLSTGVIATSSVTHATPASFVAHQPKRSMEEEIAVDFLNSDITLFIGGGRKYFADRSDKANLLDGLVKKGFKVAQDIDAIKNTTSGKLAGIVTDEHLLTYPERGEFLTESTQAALNILDNNTKGFFLMIEGSQIDWEGHDNDAEGVVNEVIDFDKAIKVAFDYADRNPGTLVIVTADHETGGMALTGGDITTGEVKASWGRTGHTSVMVPVFSYGTGAEFFTGVYENTDIFNKLMDLYDF